MTTTAPAIVTEGLHKSYGQVHALDGLDLVAEQGTILAVLGPNGSGKTTTVRILTTLLLPNSGRAEVGGLDVVQHAAAVRSLIGLTGQYAAVDETLTGYENLRMFGQLYHLSGAAARRRASVWNSPWLVAGTCRRRYKYCVPIVPARYTATA
jgi:ABC-2 type transport system ATP-binding protein